MPKYEAVINMSVEVDAKDSDNADKLVYGELTDRLLNVASRDALFKLWIDVIEINELQETNNKEKE